MFEISINSSIALTYAPVHVIDGICSFEDSNSGKDMGVYTSPSSA